MTAYIIVPLCSLSCVIIKRIMHVTDKNGGWLLGCQVCPWAWRSQFSNTFVFLAFVYITADVETGEKGKSGVSVYHVSGYEHRRSQEFIVGGTFTSLPYTFLPFPPSPLPSFSPSSPKPSLRSRPSHPFPSPFLLSFPSFPFPSSPPLFP